MRKTSWRAIVGALLATTAVLSSTACGADRQAGSEVTLAFWREQACDVLTEFAQAFSSRPPGDLDDPSPELETRALRKTSTDLRAIPPPSELRTEAERFVEMYVAFTDAYVEAAPRIEAASRRLKEAMDSVDPESLPPAPEDATVAGGIMAQLMSVREVKDAWNDMMREYEATSAAIDEKEAERLSEQLGLAKCEADAVLAD